MLKNLSDQLKKNQHLYADATSKSQRSITDSQTVIGMGATDMIGRIAASVGLMGPVAPQFKASYDVPNGGVLFALPALLVNGILKYATKYFQLPKGFYGLESVFLLLSFMALCRFKSLESLRYCAPGEWGKLLGLDRIPEVKTLRKKIAVLSCDNQVEQWSSKLCQDWMAAKPEDSSVLYVDGHVRVYHGAQTKLPRHYVSREKLCLRATTDYWVNAMDGQPFFYTNKAVDPGLIKTIETDIVPKLDELVPNQPSKTTLDSNPYLNRFTLVFDREGYSPDFFLRMWQQRISCITYHKHPTNPWPEEEFNLVDVQLAHDNRAALRLAERGIHLSGTLWLREIRKLSQSGHQTSVLSTNYNADLTKIAGQMFCRWSQENFFKYMREHYNLDRLIDYKLEDIEASTLIVNPKYRKIDGQIRSKVSKLSRKLAEFGGLNLEGDIEDKKVEDFEQKKSTLQEDIGSLQKEITQLKQHRSSTDKHIKFAELSEEDKFKKLSQQSKYFIDVIKMIAYRAETALSNLLKEHLLRKEDARALVRSIYQTEADIIPDYENNILTVNLHHIANPISSRVIMELCQELNDTKIIYPGTNLQLFYKMVSNKNP